MRRESKYDWTRILLALRKHMPYEEIAVQCGEADPSTVRSWVSKNRCPRYDDGEWLMAEFRKHYPDKPVPLRRNAYDPTSPREHAEGEDRRCPFGSLPGFSRHARAC